MNEEELQKINENIKELKTKLKVVEEYQSKLTQIFYKEFKTELCTISEDTEGDIVVTLHLAELTETDIELINQISDIYTISPNDTYTFILNIFSFRESATK